MPNMSWKTPVYELTRSNSAFHFEITWDYRISNINFIVCCNLNLYVVVIFTLSQSKSIQIHWEIFKASIRIYSRLYDMYIVWKWHLTMWMRCDINLDLISAYLHNSLLMHHLSNFHIFPSQHLESKMTDHWK